MSKVSLGGIMNRRHKGIGFDIVFQTKEEAQHYKEMMTFILKGDGYEIESVNGYHDKKEEG